MEWYFLIFTRFSVFTPSYRFEEEEFYHQPINQPYYQSYDQPINQHFHQKINQLCDQSYHQHELPLDQPVNHSLNPRMGMVDPQPRDQRQVPDFSWIFKSKFCGFSKHWKMHFHTFWLHFNRVWNRRHGYNSFSNFVSCYCSENSFSFIA